MQTALTHLHSSYLAESIPLRNTANSKKYFRLYIQGFGFFDLEKTFLTGMIIAFGCRNLRFVWEADGFLRHNIHAVLWPIWPFGAALCTRVGLQVSFPEKRRAASRQAMRHIQILAAPSAPVYKIASNDFERLPFLRDD
jgi:hypothetical protein